MQSKHGVLEGAILTALWELESKGQPNNTVKTVWENLGSEKRAYTTVKTVMDRLSTKKILTREKINKKFMYKTTFSQKQTIEKALKEIALKYCQGNMRQLQQVLEEMFVGA
ncbi:BlaI/MecI/CopY family transcriptional regulator [bacterium]|nr:BlaI/MecI/CopY family transcriptional regulator [bacterium]